MDIDEVRESYRKAIEKAIPEIPVKDGVIDLNSIWVETSLPKDLIKEIIENGEIKFPKNIKKIIFI